MTAITWRNCWRLLLPPGLDGLDKGDDLYEAWCAVYKQDKEEDDKRALAQSEVMSRLEDRQAARRVLSEIKGLTDKCIKSTSDLNEYDFAKAIHEIDRLIDNYQESETYDGGMTQ